MSPLGVAAIAFPISFTVSVGIEKWGGLFALSISVGFTAVVGLVLLFWATRDL